MNKEECKERIKEDILAYFDSVAFVHNDHGRDDLCQIVEDNFKKLEAEDDLIITQGDKKLKEMLED
tara:strand:- start:186 stop:383 length:198 start_codon:yes stop_codon:yes gene_type:complete